MSYQKLRTTVPTKTTGKGKGGITELFNIRTTPSVTDIQKQQIGGGRNKTPKKTGGGGKTAGGGGGGIDPAILARIEQRKRAFAESRLPVDAEGVHEYEDGTTSTWFMWCGWDTRKYIFPRFTGIFVSSQIGKTRGNLEKFTLQFRIHSNERCIVYGWGDQCQAVADINVVGQAYTLFSLKAMPNHGVDQEGAMLDRGGDFMFRLLFDENSRFKVGRLDDTAAEAFFRPRGKSPVVAAAVAASRATIEEIVLDEEEGEVEEPGEEDATGEQANEAMEDESEDEEEEEIEPPPPKKSKSSGKPKKAAALPLPPPHVPSTSSVIGRGVPQPQQQQQQQPQLPPINEEGPQANEVNKK